AAAEVQLQRVVGGATQDHDRPAVIGLPGEAARRLIRAKRERGQATREERAYPHCPIEMSHGASWSSTRAGEEWAGGNLGMAGGFADTTPAARDASNASAR